MPGCACRSLDQRGQRNLADAFTQVVCGCPQPGVSYPRRLPDQPDFVVTLDGPNAPEQAACVQQSRPKRLQRLLISLECGHGKRIKLKADGARPAACPFDYARQIAQGPHAPDAFFGQAGIGGGPSRVLAYHHYRLAHRRQVDLRLLERS